MQPDRLYDTASRALGVVEGYYDAEDAPLPDRRYVADGAAAWDCEQVSVWVERAYQGDAGQETVQALDCLNLAAVELVVEVVRCSPTLDDERDPPYPSAASIDASARTVLRDPVLIVSAIIAAERAGQFGANRVAVGAWQPVGPDGGYVAGRQTVHVGLYAPLPDLGD